MLAALEVELVGGDNSLAILLPVLGPLLIAGAAVIAALVARRTANERQEEQLTHDTERQERQITHDTERQEQALAHDRDMRDRESDRTVADAAIEGAHKVLEKVSSCEGRVEVFQSLSVGPGQDEQAGKVRKEARDFLKEAKDGVIALGFHGLRVSSRPGLDKLTSSFNELLAYYRTQVRLLQGLIDDATSQRWEELKRQRGEGPEKFAALLFAWRKWLKTH